MAKSFLIISAGPVVVPVGSKQTLINAGASPIFIADTEASSAMAMLDESAKQSVLKALYSIEPGKALPLRAGTYVLSFGLSLQASAVLCIETTAPKNPTPKPETPPSNPETNPETPPINPESNPDTEQTGN
ncbi:hypothetical protein GCM10027347_58730 [Larkinella harenae]